ncbi:MAG TPA: ABC transporter ATP-binding protein [Pseudonocardiaceae bacterium]|jgi:ATP-binding cassette subfamily C protein|nr:ABC transporter ATP-binding protein [Pseudonocardiaceae bacterium]
MTVGAAALYRGALRGQRKSIGILAAWSIVDGLPALLSGRLVALAVDNGFAIGKAGTGAFWLASYGLVSLLGAFAARGVYGRLGEVVEPMRDALVTAVVHGVLHDVSTTRHQPDAAAVARITRHIEVIRDVTAGILIQARGLAVTTVAALIGLLGTASALAPLVLVPVGLAVALGIGLLGTLARRQRELVLADERCAQLAGSVYTGLRDMVSCGAEAVSGRRIGEVVDAQARAAVRLGNASATRELITSLGGLIPLLLVLLSAPAMVADGRLTVGAVLGAVVYLATNVQPALVGLGQTAGSTVLRLVVTLRRLAELAGQPEPPSARVSPPETCELALRGVTFGWGASAQPVVVDLDLDLPAGRHLAIVGASGIGKSTLAGLLTGLLRPQQGRVTLGDLPVDTLTSDLRRRLITLIPQQAYVFAGTLRENLALLLDDPTDDALIAAAGAVGAAGLVARLGGLDAALGHGGGALSAGERQLIALARAYVSEAKVVVLDEATANLDPAAEATVERAFARRGGTLVVIAHRLSSALRAEEVLVMTDRSALLGAHDDLLRTSTGYADLMRAWTGRAPESAPEPVGGP